MLWVTYIFPFRCLARPIRPRAGELWKSFPAPPPLPPPPPHPSLFLSLFFALSFPLLSLSSSRSLPYYRMSFSSCRLTRYANFYFVTSTFPIFKLAFARARERWPVLASWALQAISHAESLPLSLPPRRGRSSPIRRVHAKFVELTFRASTHARLAFV